MNEDLDRAVNERDQAYYDYQNEYDEQPLSARSIIEFSDNQNQAIQNVYEKRAIARKQKEDTDKRKFDEDQYIQEQKERRDRFDQDGIVLENVAYANTDQENLLNTICNKCGQSFPMLMIFMHQAQCKGPEE